MTEEEIKLLLEEGEEKFPVGTKFHSTGGNRDCIRNPGSELIMETDGCIRVKNHEVRGKHGTTEGRIYHSSLGWAQILFRPETELKIIAQFPIY
jgi:hypothetical protein